MCGRRRKYTEAGFARRLVVMVKEPVAGRVKTRLAREIGACGALRFYRSATTALLARTARDPRWHTYLAVSPDAARTSRVWPAHVQRVGQGRGDLGMRMQRVFDRHWRGPVVIIGSDIPGIRAGHIAAAWRALRCCDAVIGPAPDGGYWLVGLRRCPRVPQIFQRVRWSSAHTLEDTLANLRNHRVARLAMLADVDCAADHAALGPLAGRRILAAKADLVKVT